MYMYKVALIHLDYKQVLTSVKVNEPKTQSNSY